MKGAVAALLALGMLLGASGGDALVRIDPPSVAAPIPPRPATVTLPVPQVPAFVRDVSTPATVGPARAGGGPALLDGDLLAAYTFAVAVSPERCHLPLSLLAAIGQVESGNAAGHTIDADHRVVPAIIGPALDGSRYAAVPDTDGGVLDRDPSWDRAVGPFQFLPSSWRVAGVDFDDDGIRDPQNVYDAAGAAMVYLCADDRDLADPRQLDDAVLAYNRSTVYLRAVLAWKAVFDGGRSLWDVSPVPVLEASARARPAPPLALSGPVAQDTAEGSPPAAAQGESPPAESSPAESSPAESPPAESPPAAQEPAEEPGPGPAEETPDPVAEPPAPPDACAEPEQPTAEEQSEQEPTEQEPPETGTDPEQQETPTSDDCAPVPEPTEPEQTDPEPTEPEQTDPEQTDPGQTEPSAPGELAETETQRR